jgi:hypothetical protein
VQPYAIFCLMWRTVFIGSSVDSTFGTVTYAVIFMFRKWVPAGPPVPPPHPPTRVPTPSHRSVSVCAVPFAKRAGGRLDVLVLIQPPLPLHPHPHTQLHAALPPPPSHPFAASAFP